MTGPFRVFSSKAYDGTGAPVFPPQINPIIAYIAKPEDPS